MTIKLIQLYVEAIPVQSRCNADQQSLLLRLKETLIFDSSVSSKLIYWNSSTNCCSWAGVSCTDGLVIGLDISEESISGGIDNSSILFDLQHLQSLNLANNYASNASQIPSAIGRLTNLRNDFIDTQLKLENPNLSMLIQNLTELTELYLDYVYISSAHGAHWSQAISSSLPKLKVLSLRGCNIPGPIHQSFAKLQSLSVLLLDWNDISAPVPGFFANFSSLTSLSLSYCNLYGTFPEEIFQITTLQKVDLQWNPRLQGSLPEFLNNGSLQSLDLSSSKFSGFLPKSIGNLKMLSTLQLSGCSFTGSIPNSVANLTQLNFLAMSLNSFNSPIDSIHWENLVNLEFLALDSNLLHGSIPLSPFSLPVLRKLVLPHNQFYGQLPEFANISSNLLDTLHLSGNHLEGPIPTSIFNLRGLQKLKLSSNHFSGFPFNGPQQPKNLSFLDLSNNSLLIDCNGSSPTTSSFLQINSLDLSSNKLRAFPDFLRNQSRLAVLDLSENQIQGKIPNWIWKLNSLHQLNLSYNDLATLQGPLLNLTSTVSVLDLRSNNLQGQIPVFLSSATYLDYSRNNFSSSIPADIGDFLHSTAFFSLSSNNLHGIIPPSICNASDLVLVDLSNNSLSGMIPECLTGLSVLNLRSNNLTGPIPDKFDEFCGLHTLDLSRNQIQGQFPKSLVNCTQLKVVNLGNNQITDTFPCLLKNISTLRVLVLRSNQFYGRIGCPEANGSWPMLQIIDLAYNNLSGKIPGTSMTTWKEMMVNEDDSLVNLGADFGTGGSAPNFYYGDAVTITSKGSAMDLVKIPTFFTLIDFSCNEFSGSIPEEMGEFKSLYVLNLSCNAFTGEIPSSFGNMRVLESLDLSKNNLSGQIPPQLANLTFLSFLNLSNNQLVGRIPTSTQFSTFPKASFAGNKGLWGPPLTADDKAGLPVPPPASNESRRSSGHEINWDLISVEIGFVFGFGVAIGSLAFYKRWRNWYYKATLNIIFKMFPQLHQRLGNQGRHVYINQRRRR
ncbi:receptor-like protein 12 [Prunus avium]|uniref:Receptor-like protein 12 n=1 Tax=Prunus avium TaxID=42229 RepID=A0A6P5TZ53_PRUAV|nr:receptor-like protein 12 [Prunus avium]